MGNKIVYIDRKSGELVEEKTPGAKMIHFLYFNPFGKLALNGFIKRKFYSYICGKLADMSFTKRWIPKFMEDHQITDEEFEKNWQDFTCFNDFFYRKLKSDARPIEQGLVSPADGKVVAFEKVSEQTCFYVKGQSFSLKTYLQDDQLSKKYEGGSMLIVRLAPTDYHRFHFPATGKVSKSKHIKGCYKSVSPLAMDKSLEIFCENVREYCEMQTEEYGDILISEIGATMVGSIVQTYTADSVVQKGDEKGYFTFGGSSMLLLFEKGKVKLDQDLLENTKKQIETQVLMGNKIGE
ncbi:phosphatidylserine decarboxylase [Algivirga pacifica]|uniref:phosphatidylserine decarboxylase n=1 Tax=Algivirga pacifica TaxID=1162670 RepID=A0ABP9DL45_9BACT